MTLGNFGVESSTLAAIPVHVWELKERLLRVTDKPKKCVCFIGIENAQHQFIPLGTAFFAGLNCDGFHFCFLVTAMHVLEQIRGDHFYARINTHQGEARTIRLPKNHLRPDDKSLDIALVPVTLDTTIYDYLVIELSREAWKKECEKYISPEAGEEVLVVGVYTSHFGSVKNIPIVRTGHIAAMPQEKVRTNIGYVTGYLIEVHSIAGLSGSLVYLAVPTTRVKDNKFEYMQGDAVPIPIGILIGHHVIETKEDEILVPKFQNDAEFEAKNSGLEERRTGFAVVVAIENLFDYMETEKVQELLKRSAEALSSKKSGFKPDSVALAEPPTNIAAVSGKEAFNSLLSAATRKQKTTD